MTALTGLAAATTGIIGAATAVTLLVAGALKYGPFVSLHVKLIVPAGPAVNVIVFLPEAVTPAVPPALVIVPPAIDHTYVKPVRAVTWAVRPEAPSVTGLADVIVGVLGAFATTGMLVLAGGRVSLAAFPSTTLRTTGPVAAAVYVILLPPPLVTPAGPPELVIVALVTVHVYFMPVTATTVAVFPVDDGETAVAAVIVGVCGSAATATLLFPVRTLPLRTAMTPSVSVPGAPAVNVGVRVPCPAVIVPFWMVQVYVAPFQLVVDAASPVAPVETFAGAVMVELLEAVNVVDALPVSEGAATSLTVTV